MNVVFISPHFPSNFAHFCSALRDRGVSVLGLGDAPYEQLSHELRQSLREYYFCPQLESYHEAHRALGYLVWRHGRIDRIESHNEHWLPLEAKLRDDFNVPGPRPSELAIHRSKTGMADLFTKAGVSYPRGERFTTAERAREFAKKNGFPIVCKPDVGVGAARTFKIEDERALDAALQQKLDGFILQPFVRGAITTYDGLVNKDGKIVFATSQVYSSGVMEIVNQRLDLSYWNRREIPAELERQGKAAVEAFGVRDRFFHVEFFEVGENKYQALEINLRPPGGFTLDMMNYAADVDLYRQWAAMVTGDSLESFKYEVKYHVCHIARRHGRHYRRPHDVVVRELGGMLLWHRQMPPAFAGAMGDEVYLVRHAEMARIHDAIRMVQETA